MITSMLRWIGKTLEAKERKNAVLFIAVFILFFQASGLSQWDLSALQAPKLLRLESQVLHEQVALGDGYQVKPKWRRCGQNWRENRGYKFPKIKF